MAYDYNKAKQAWEMMDDNQKKQYTEQNKNDANFQQFAQQYHNETQGSSVWGVNQNNNNNYWWWTNTPPVQNNNQNQNNDNGVNYDFSNYHSSLSDWKNWDWKFYGNTQFDKEEQFDSSMIGNTQWIKIQEWTGKDTGRPDYQIDTDARLNEMRNNLNQYYQTNPEWFQDRETFNRQFEYNQRESDAQRALLDSYWKKAQDMRTVNNYTNWDSVMAGFNNYDITPDQMSLLRQYNPDAYAQWQKQMQDELNARITNLAAPRDVWDTVDLWWEIVKKLWIEAGDPYDIYGTWYNMAEQLWVFRDSQQLASMSNNIASIYATMNSNVQNISSQLEGRYSAGYIEARINKANSRLNSQASSMQYSYNLLLQKRNQNMAIAQQAGAMKQAQGQEDSRVFNNKLNALKFAMTADSYRTPEQQQQLLLQTEQIRNDMSLLNQSKLNDLSLYNQYATAKLKNQLEYELQDLNVKDPAQLRANLSRVLDQYYSQYWDIIQRPKQQVIDDVIAYAKANWISVAEALKKNFIEPLQSKPEYQNSVANKYPDPYLKYQDNYDWSIDENWNFKISWKWYWTPNLTDIQKEYLLANKQTYPWAFSWDLSRNVWYRNNNPWNIKDKWFWNVLGTDASWFAIFATPEDWFDALVMKLQNAINWNSKTYPATSTLYQFFEKYAPKKDNNNPKAYAESVAKQLWIKANTQIKDIKDVEKFAAAIAKHDSWYNYSTYWQYRASNNTAGNLWDFSLRDWTTYDTSNAPTYNSLTYDQQNTVKWLLNLSINPSTITKRQYWDDFEKILSAVQEINPSWSTADYWQADKTKKEWNTSSKNGSNSRNATAAQTAKEIYDMADDLWNATFKDWNSLMNFLKKRVSNEKFLELQVNMETMASEFAWALKGWNAAPSTEEINDKKQLIASNFSKWGMKAAAKQIIRQLYNKNVTEADNYRAVTLEKPNPIWIGDLPDFMVNELWLNLSDYYNYKWLWDYFTDDEFDKTNDSDDDFIIYMTNWKK